MKKILISGLLALFVQAITAKGIVIQSPDRKISFQLYTGNHRLLFTLSAGDKRLISPSPLLFSVDGDTLTSGSGITGIQRYQASETYPWMGAHAKAVDAYNGMVIRLRKEGRAYAIDIRVFDNGAAFRFIAPGPDSAARVPDEGTVFKLPAGAVLWYHDLTGHYEGDYKRKNLAQLRDSEWVAPPATLKLPSGWYLAITEANLRDYAGSALQADGQNGLVWRLAHHQPASHPFVVRYSAADVARLALPAVVQGEIRTPWRVVMAGKDLNTMVNNDMVHNLCPPPDSTLFPDGLFTNWIKPGRAVWKYLDGGGDGTPETMKRFTDEAAALGFEHNILEGFWTKWTDAQLKNLVDYSREKNVGIWLWVHSKTLHDPADRKALFQHCHDLGITGLKIDFFDHEAKEVIDLYTSILEETAAFHLLVDFHGSDKPTGLSRTWPNEMTREAVRGMESSRLMDRATHETTLPFTRLLAGPAEYTVVLFGDRRRNTTWTHQLASAVILGGTPLLTYAANPASLLSNPAVGVIRQIPAYWDETRVLPGSEIGQMAVFARRKGPDWFLAVMNGAEPRRVRITLDFLKGPSTATIVRDTPGNPAALEMDSTTATPAGVLTLDLEAGGGYLMLLHNQTPQ